MYYTHTDNIFLKHFIPKKKKKMKNYGMEIHTKKNNFQHYTKGIHFLGSYIKPYRTHVSSVTKNNI